jgi:hypothetical protein
MIKSTIENMANPIGFEIGTSDDRTQAELLNGFCKGLKNSMPDKSNLNMQLCYIADKLDSNTENLLLEIVEYVKVKQAEK